LGEYCDSREGVQAVMTLIRQSLGNLPIVDDEVTGEYGAIDDTQLKTKVSTGI
jgi:coatomer subunit beta